MATYGITFQIDFLKFILNFTLLAMETYGITSHCFHSLTCVAYTYIYIYIYIYGCYWDLFETRGRQGSGAII